MRMLRIGMGNRNQNHPMRCKCGCTSGSFHFHHEEVAKPGDHETGIFNSLERETDGNRVFGPSGLMNMATERRNGGVDASALNGRLRNLAVGDQVKLCFVVTDQAFRWLPAEMRDMGRNCQSEAMFVKITAAEGEWPDFTFDGELLNMPILIDPDRLRLGSQIRFTPQHVHSC